MYNALHHSEVLVDCLKVEEGRRKQLTRSHISAEDPDSILTNLMVVVDSIPTLGTIKIITQGTQINVVIDNQTYRLSI